MFCSGGAPNKLDWPGLGGLLGVSVMVTSSTSPSISLCTEQHLQQGSMEHFLEAVWVLCATSAEKDP